MTDPAEIRSGPSPALADSGALRALADGYHARTVRALDSSEIAGHLVKSYAVEAPGRTVTDRHAQAGLRIAADHLSSAYLRGSLGLAVLLVHAAAMATTSWCTPGSRGTWPTSPSSPGLGR
ncbi:hypothetical protein LUW77_01330 [Streptomyces radiopugnans]|nr:hypothetical protein LUW77_01330 [Streptomyces radiopugnans]